MSIRRGWIGLPRHSSRFPNAEVDGAQDGSWRHRRFAQPYLAAKSSHVGVDVDGLACHLHHPTDCDCQMRGQSFLSGASLSHCTIVGGDMFLGGMKPSGLDI
jgi:hypothetical protein